MAMVKVGAWLFIVGLLAMFDFKWPALGGCLMLADAALYGVGMLAGLLSLRGE